MSKGLLHFSDTTKPSQYGGGGIADIENYPIVCKPVYFEATSAELLAQANQTTSTQATPMEDHFTKAEQDYHQLKQQMIRCRSTDLIVERKALAEKRRTIQNEWKDANQNRSRRQVLAISIVDRLKYLSGETNNKKSSLTRSQMLTMLLKDTPIPSTALPLTSAGLTGQTPVLSNS